MQLIKTDDYLLFVDKEAKLEKGDYHLEKGLIINKFPDYLTDLDECDKILAYYPLTPQSKSLELPLLPNPYQFSLEDIKNTFNAAREKFTDYQGNVYDSAEDYINELTINLYIQRLPKEFSSTYELVGQCNCECHVPGNWVMHVMPCCEPKRIMKIIKNSENKDELVGTYKY